MTKKQTLDLLRLVSGELAAAEATRLRRRIAADRALAADAARLEAVWHSLELPPTEPVPADFRSQLHLRLAGLVERQRAKAQAKHLGWSGAPLWVRTLAACALAGGVLLGVLAASRPLASPWDTGYLSSEPTLAETYWWSFEDAASEAGWSPGGTQEPPEEMR